MEDRHFKYLFLVLWIAFLLGCGIMYIAVKPYYYNTDINAIEVHQ